MIFNGPIMRAFSYRESVIDQLAGDSGFALDHLGDWGHPHGQLMARLVAG